MEVVSGVGWSHGVQVLSKMAGKTWAMGCEVTGDGHLSANLGLGHMSVLLSVWA